MQMEGNISVARQNLGSRINHMRKQQGLSQYQFSAMIGMDRTYLIGVEKGRRNISFDNIMRIAQGLDVPIADLFEDIDIEMQRR